MSQRYCYELLKELGGTATIETIEKELKTRDQGMYRNRNVFTLMRRLEAWGYVEWNQKKKTYTIKEPYPATIIDCSPITEADIIE